MVTFASARPAGTIVPAESQDGQDVLTFAPAKAYQSLALSSPELKLGTAYRLFTGGSATGAAVDGRYGTGAGSGGT
jgi:hypothetical protein